MLQLKPDEVTYEQLAIVLNIPLMEGYYYSNAQIQVEIQNIEEV